MESSSGEVGSDERAERLQSPNGKNPSPLCSECKAIFDSWYSRDNWTEARPGHLHHHIVGLQESSRKGCPVCSLFLNGLSEADIQRVLQHQAWKRSLVTVDLHFPNLKDYYVVNLTFDDPDSHERYRSAGAAETKLYAFRSGQCARLRHRSGLTPQQSAVI